jgi:hypothetical protein
MKIATNIPEPPAAVSFLDYVDKSLLIFPREIREVMTKQGRNATVVVCDVWQLSADGNSLDRAPDELLCFWTAVTDQLAHFVGESAIIGKIEKRDRRYELVDTSDKHAQRIQELAAQLDAAPAEPAGADDEEPF